MRDLHALYLDVSIERRAVLPSSPNMNESWVEEGIGAVTGKRDTWTRRQLNPQHCRHRRHTQITQIRQRHDRHMLLQWGSLSIRPALSSHTAREKRMWQCKTTQVGDDESGALKGTQRDICFASHISRYRWTCSPLFHVNFSSQHSVIISRTQRGVLDNFLSQIKKLSTFFQGRLRKTDDWRRRDGRSVFWLFFFLSSLFSVLFVYIYF